MRKFRLDDAVYTYLITKKKKSEFSNHVIFGRSGLVINYTSKTELILEKDADKCVAIVGLCIDALGKLKRREIPGFLMQQVGKPTTIFQLCERFAGKYIILYENEEEVYIWGDATCSIPINYGFSRQEGNFVAISPFDKMTANCINEQCDTYLEKIRLGQDASQAMPGDLTPYRGVHALLPNQFLAIGSKKVFRTSLELHGLGRKDYDGTIATTCDLAMTITEEYGRYTSMVCPITSGYDSRLVFGVVNKVMPETVCFTQKYKNFDENTADLSLPRQICTDFGSSYRALPYVEVPTDYISDVCECAGYNNSRENIEEAYMYTEKFPSEARLNGNIAGQIGKSSVVNNVPEFFATASFLKCKIHNIDNNVTKEIKKYLKELKKSGPNRCDLFVLENRCGRWAGQEEALYSLCGMNSLNIFNCRRLINAWMSLDRGYRVKKKMHKRFLEMCNKRLLQYPFNPGERFTFLKSNWVLYYLATYMKQVLLKFGVHCD